MRHRKWVIHFVTTQIAAVHVDAVSIGTPPLDPSLTRHCAGRSDLEGSSNLAERVSKILGTPGKAHVIPRTSSGLSDADKERREPGIKVSAP